MSGHRSSFCKQKETGEGYYVSSFAMFDEYGLDERKIELIEDYPCNSQEELLRREGHYIKNTDCANRRKFRSLTSDNMDS